MKNIYFFLVLSVLILASSCDKEDEEVSLCEGEEICNVQLYPNPVVDTLNLVFNSDIVTELEMSLLELTGRKVLVQTIQTNRGENNITFDLSHLESGAYIFFLKEEESAFKSTHKILLNH